MHFTLVRFSIKINHKQQSIESNNVYEMITTIVYSLFFIIYLYCKRA